MKLNPIFPVSILSLLITACSVHQKNSITETPLAINLDTLTTKEHSLKETTIPPYQASAARINDILHTKLEVSFDWKNQFMFGKATITIKPYFYSTSVLDLDARGMEIKQVALVNGDKKQDLHYSYTDDVLHINLGKEYKNTETYTVYIDYTAKPNTLKQGGSEAIKSDKGLYFINPEGKEKNKPMQIWTQGETQSNSAWMPTIDRPNERMTQEIFITTEDKFVTLSNGELVASFNNGDGTHTDHWKMDLPHAPYLAMMTIGEFAIVKDKWKDKQVNYYVEKEYEPYAKNIFGNTPEMMSFYSDKLGVPFQWNKYSQIIVRDYVSGAMENTSATLHGEFLQQTKREMIDNNFESVIAHELFHQWFGDLVTCESWSNLPLNESFATYGEYLWEEYKYGRDAADDHSCESREQYFAETLRKKVPLIRFEYDNREDMFDRHSYNKGGQVLHMLRKYVGDDAFFSSLKLYLETNKFNSVEIHNLRLAFEQVTGEDLNWFFNQWFLSSGHPELVINSVYDEQTKKQKIEITQKQDLSKSPLFEIPMFIDIYSNGNVKREKIRITKNPQVISFDVNQKPDLVNVDAEKALLATKSEKKSNAEWAFQYLHAPLYLDRYEALNGLAEKEPDSLAIELFITGLNDPYWKLREKCIALLEHNNPTFQKRMQDKLIQMAKTDAKSLVREAAINSLSKNYTGNELVTLYEGALADSSYKVISAGLAAIAKVDSVKGLAMASKLENEKNPAITLGVMKVYELYGSEKNNTFYVNAADNFKGYYKIGYIINYGKFLQRINDNEILNAGVDYLASIAKDDASNPYFVYFSKKAIDDLKTSVTKRIDSLTTQLSNSKSESEKNHIQQKLNQEEQKKKYIETVYDSIKK